MFEISPEQTSLIGEHRSSSGQVGKEGTDYVVSEEQRWTHGKVDSRVRLRLSQSEHSSRVDSTKAPSVFEGHSPWG